MSEKVYTPAEVLQILREKTFPAVSSILTKGDYTVLEVEAIFLAISSLFERDLRDGDARPVVVLASFQDYLLDEWGPVFEPHFQTVPVFWGSQFGTADRAVKAILLYRPAAVVLRMTSAAAIMEVATAAHKLGAQVVLVTRNKPAESGYAIDQVVAKFAHPNDSAKQLLEVVLQLLSEEVEA